MTRFVRLVPEGNQGSSLRTSAVHPLGTIRRHRSPRWWSRPEDEIGHAVHVHRAVATRFMKPAGYVGIATGSLEA